MAVSSVGTTTRIDEEGLASGKRDAVQPELNKDGKPLPPNNDGNTPKVLPVVLRKFSQYNDFEIKPSTYGVNPL